MGQKDLDLISGDFFNIKLPKDKKYLNKYFRGRIEKVFLKYYLIFGETTFFVRHTGIRVDPKNLHTMREKLLKIIRNKEKSAEEFNLEKLGKIASGKYRYKQDKE